MRLSTSDLMKNQKHRNGIVVEADKLEQIKSILLYVLVDFDNICSKYDLHYSLCGGSMLGAIRHHGFIPWDDDVDVFMTRDSYDKFVDIYKKELIGKYTLHSPETNPQDGMPLAQLSLNGTIYRTHLAPNRDNPGIFMDIFILENTPDNYWLRMLHCFFSMATGLLLSCARMYKDREITRQFFSSADDYTKDVIDKKIMIGSFVTKFISVKNICYLNNWVNRFCKNDKSSHVACPTGRKHYWGEVYEREIITNVVKRSFEGEMFFTIKDADSYLKRLYGIDYMTPPPMEKREVHCVMELDLGECNL